MALILVAPAIEIVEVLLIRLGLARWVSFAALRTLLSGLTLKATQLTPIIANWLATKGIYYTALLAYIGNELGVTKEKLDEWWTDAQGGIKGVAFKYANQLFRDTLEDYLRGRHAESEIASELTVLSSYELLPIDKNNLQPLLSLMGLIIILEVKRAYTPLKESGITNIYPPAQFVESVKQEVIAEVQSGGGVFLSGADVASIKATISTLENNAIVQAVGIYLPEGENPAQVPLSVKQARRRAQLRNAQRKYRETHTRNHVWILR